MIARFRGLFAGPASAALVLVMLAGCLFLWVGVPLGWLWIGSQVQGSLSLGTALFVTMAGITVTIIVVVIALGWLNRWQAELRERRNRPNQAPQQRRGSATPPSSGSSALEVMLVSSAGIAIVGFGIWFFGFAGASPVPLNIGF
jgi:heme/copper-type cytochrome/quinol oxidase subunit 2